MKVPLYQKSEAGVAEAVLPEDKSHKSEIYDG